MGPQPVAMPGAASRATALPARCDTQDLRRWLARHRVSDTKVAELLLKSGCSDIQGLALYLRFQLPPLDYANYDSVADHMKTLFGVGSRTGWRMVHELRVAGAVQPHSVCALDPHAQEWRPSCSLCTALQRSCVALARKHL
jgi:hypothetical protein